MASLEPDGTARNAHAARRRAEYGPAAKTLHWTVAALVLALLGLGLAMVRWPANWLSPLPLALKSELYQLHKSLGLTVLALMLARLIIRAVRGAPPLPDTLPAWERRAARITHAALYVLLIAQPLIGWLLVSASRVRLGSVAIAVPTHWFDLFTVPHLPALAALAPAEADRWAGIFKSLHTATAIALTALVALHVGAALRHHWVLRDDILARMAPRLGRSRKGRSRPLALSLAPALALALAALAIQPVAIAAAVPARAASDGVTPKTAVPEWRIDPAQSAIAFTARVSGQAVKGRFTRFTARIAFDPADPAMASVEVQIDIASLATGQAELDAALRGADWFDVAAHPLAIYRARGARRMEDGRYALDGTLTLRGVSRPLTLPFTLELRGRNALARAAATLDRTAFGIGPRGAISGLTVAPEVRVEIAVAARRAP